MNLSITSAAKCYLAAQAAKLGPTVRLRISTARSVATGLSYKFGFGESPGPGEFVAVVNDFEIITDRDTSALIDGSTLDINSASGHPRLSLTSQVDYGVFCKRHHHRSNCEIAASSAPQVPRAC